MEFQRFVLMLFLLGSPGSAQVSRQFEVPDGSLRPALGTVWLVPQDGGGVRIPQPTIQAAVDAASDGDMVLLSDGTFRGPGNHSVYVSGKDLTIRSENGAARTFIDCQRQGRGFLFDGVNVTDRTLLRGISILRGVAPNDIPGRIGGGVLANDSLPTVEACTIIDCNAGIGGGIGYYPIDTSRVGQIRDCIIKDNFASDSGGGISGASIVIDRCFVIDNAADCEGGGVEILFDGAIRNSLIANNTSLSPFHPTAGGGLLIHGIVRIESCTVVGNAALFGGGIGLLPCATSVISNCIFWENQAQVGKEAYYTPVCGPFRPTFRYCNVQGGEASIVGTPPTPPPLLIALTNEDPLFVGLASADYHLSADSPMIDAGDPRLPFAPNEADFDTHPRPHGLFDIGADEYYPGLAHTIVIPGRPGETSTVAVTGANPGELVFFFTGLESGVTSLAFGFCPSLALDIGSASFLGASIAGNSGTSSWAQHVPASLSGITTLQQAVGFDPLQPLKGCSTSNLVSFTFP